MTIAFRGSFDSAHDGFLLVRHNRPDVLLILELYNTALLKHLKRVLQAAD